jgi:hypothetical protein
MQIEVLSNDGERATIRLEDGRECTVDRAGRCSQVRFLEDFPPGEALPAHCDFSFKQ